MQNVHMPRDLQPGPVQARQTIAHRKETDMKTHNAVVRVPMIASILTFVAFASA